MKIPNSHPEIAVNYLVSKAISSIFYTVYDVSEKIDKLHPVFGENSGCKSDKKSYTSKIAFKIAKISIKKARDAKKQDVFIEKSYIPPFLQWKT